MERFEEYIYQRIADTMQSWRSRDVEDIYAVSFYFWCEEDDLRQVCVTVGYNTREHWHSYKTEPRDKEVKWNYAYWLQNKETVIGCTYGPHCNELDTQLRVSWIKEQGLGYTDEEEREDFDRTLDLGGEIVARFVEMLSRIGRRLHDEGIVCSVFGRPIPIIVHDLEYSGAEDYTHDANPPFVAYGFEAWVRSGFRD